MSQKDTVPFVGERIGMPLSASDLEHLSESELRNLLAQVINTANTLITKRPLTYKFTPDNPVVEMLDSVPTLEFSKELSHLPDDGSVVHRLLIGDNFQTLAGLRAAAASHTDTRLGVYDIIYIDPPYNTGRQDMVYNDRFLDENATYRHTKWLSFMEPRLRIAYDLLKDDGVIMVAIGHQENARLRMMLDAIFGEDNFIEQVTWSAGKHSDAWFISSSTDYMLVYTKNVPALKRRGKWRGMDPLAADYFAAANAVWTSTSGVSDITTRRETARKEFAKVVRTRFKDATTALKTFKHFDVHGRLYSASGDVSFAGGNGYTYDVIHPVTGEVCAIPSRGYVCPQETMREWIAQGLIEFGEDHTTQIKKRRFEYTGEVLDNIIDKVRTNANRHLKAILGPNVFQHPKDHFVLAEWFDAIGGSDAKVLDFFGGSGTTAEAVLLLNSKDGGHREVTIVVDDFNRIGTDITRERIVRVMTGEGWSDGKSHSGYGGQLVVHRVGTQPYPDRVLEDRFQSWSRHAGAWAAYLKTPVEVSDDGIHMVLSDNNGRYAIVGYADCPDGDLIEEFLDSHPGSDAYVIATESGYFYTQLFDGSEPFIALPDIQLRAVWRSVKTAVDNSGARVFTVNSSDTTKEKN